MIPGLTPDQLAKADTNQLVLILLITTVPTVIGLLALIARFVTESRKRKEEMEQVRVNAETAIEKLREETEITIRKTREEADQKQKSAQLGVVAQLADQMQTMMSSQDRSLRLMEQQVSQISELVQQKEVLVGIIDKQQETAKDRNIVQREQYARIEETQKGIITAFEASVNKLHEDINRDFKHWIEGLRADGELQSAMLAIRDMPNRMNKTDLALLEINTKVDDIPKQVTIELRTELELLSGHIDSVVRKLLEAQNVEQSITDGGSKAIIEAVTQPTIHATSIDSVTILRDTSDQPH